MNINEGPNNPASVEHLTPAQLLGEAERIARLADLNGVPYTAAILRRLVKTLKSRDEAEQAWIKVRCDTAAAMRRGEAI